VVSVGGGSVLDTAKAVAPCLADACQALDLVGIDTLAALLAGVGHPTALSDLGVTEADLGPSAELAVADLITLANARAARSPGEVVALDHKAM
jgi:alcohol dehydrogenase class IV